jgi:integrase
MSYKPHPTIDRAWIIDWRPDGRKGTRKRLTVFDKSEAEALAIEARLRQSPAGVPHNATNPLLLSVIPIWLDWMTLHRSEATVKSIGWALTHLQPHFGHLTVGQITEREVITYQQQRRATPRSCNLELDYLKSLISWMVQRHYCLPLPFKIERLKYIKPLPRVPSPEDLAHWFSCIEHDGPWDKINKVRLPGPKTALIWIMIRCGLRFSEATHLQWQDLDWSDNIIYLSRTKGDRPRIAILPEEARVILDPIKKESGLIAPSIKTSKDGIEKPYGNMKSLFAHASKKSGVDIKGPHTLRHACGTHTLAATGDLRLVMETLGHTQIKTSQIYTHINTDRLRAGQQSTRVHGDNKINAKAQKKQDVK